MKRNKFNRFRLAAHCYQSGLSLIELMVGMLIGLLLVAVAGAAFLGQSANTRSNDESSRIQETGRLAISSIERSLRYAGFVPFGEVIDSNKALGDYCKFPTVSTDIASGPPSDGPFVEGRDGTGHLNSSDRLVYRMFGSGLDSQADGDGGIRDCRGESVPSPAAASPNVVNTLYVDTDVGGEPALFCRVRIPGAATASVTQALVPGVESMQVQYIVDASTPTVSKRQLLRASQVSDWSKVLAVKISLMLRGEVNSRADKDTKVTDMFDEDYTSSAGAGHTGASFDPAVTVAGAAQFRLRRVFTTTVEFRNSPGLSSLCI